MIRRVGTQTCPSLFNARIREFRNHFDRGGENLLDSSCGDLFVEADVFYGCARENPAIVARDEVNLLAPDHALNFYSIGAQRNHLPFRGTNWRELFHAFYLRRKTSRCNDSPFRIDCFISQLQSSAAIPFLHNSSDAFAREDFDSAFLGGAQQCMRERAIVDGCFVGPQRCGFQFRAERWLEFARVFWAKRFGFQSHSVVERNQRAQIRNRLLVEENVDRALRTKTNFLARDFFNVRDQRWIQIHAGFREWNHRDHRGGFWRGRKDSGAGPGRFASWFAAVEHSDFQSRLREFQCDGCADESSACDCNVERFHNAILAHSALVIFSAPARA